MAASEITPDRLAFTVFALIVAGSVVFLAAVGWVFL